MSEERIVYQRKQYIVKEVDNGHILYNRLGKFDEHHTHIKGLKTCIGLINMIERNIVPDSSYLRESCLRICMDKKFIEKVLHKIGKDLSKPKYMNVSKGINNIRKK